MLTVDMLPRLQRLIADAGLDGWLLYDFRGTNAIAHGLLGFEGLVSRRIFAYIPRDGVPIGIQHAIEPGPWARWPTAWPLRVYSGWRSLEQELHTLVAGKRIAMEYSAGDAIPYLDRAGWCLGDGAGDWRHRRDVGAAGVACVCHVDGAATRVA